MSYFNDDQTKGQENNSDQNQEDWVEKLAREKGEQWRDPQALAKGYLHSQEMIAQLKQTTEEMREDLGKKEYVETLIAKLQQGQAQPPAKEPVVEDSGTGNKGDTPQELSEDTLKNLIIETLTQREQHNTAQQNLDATDKKLSELFGTEAAKVVAERSKELGLDKEKLKAIASESPNAFFKLIGEKTDVQFNPNTGGSVNTAAGFMNQPSKRNFAYYQKLRRELSSREYYSPKIQNQMLKDAHELGDSFYN